MCAPKSYRPTITLAHVCLRLAPSTLVAHVPPTGSLSGPWTPCSPLEEPKGPPRSQAPHMCTLVDTVTSTGHALARVRSPEQGSSNSCSGESPAEVPPCLGFTSRSWSRARFFSWGGGRERGGPESPAPSHPQGGEDGRDPRQSRPGCPCCPGSVEELGSAEGPPPHQAFCPHPAQYRAPHHRQVRATIPMGPGKQACQYQLELEAPEVYPAPLYRWGNRGPGT